MKITEVQEQAAYRQGKVARLARQDRYNSNPYRVLKNSDAILRHKFLSGWHDTDQLMREQGQEKRRTYKSQVE